MGTVVFTFKGLESLIGMGNVTLQQTITPAPWTLSSLTLGSYYVRGFEFTYAQPIAYAVLAIPVAIHAIKFLVEHHKEIRPKIIKAKNIVLSHFTPRAGETRDQAAKRIAKNIGIVAAGVVVLAAICVSIYALIKLGIFALAVSTLWSLWEKLSIAKYLIKFANNLPEKPWMVFTGYALIGLLHFIQMYRAIKNHEKMEAVKHLFAGAVAWTAIPIMALGVQEIRWHHLSYGLISMLPSNMPAINVFGACTSIDSLLYWIKPERDNYDISNIYVKNSTLFIVGLTAMTIIEVGVRIFKMIKAHKAKQLKSHPAA